ncbi:MAG: glucuronate isomerase [Bacteroidota bacterium]
MTTIKPFLNDHFLLENKMAEVLYHDYAKDLPIIDYHNHLPPDEIAQNRQFETITQVWLAGDHYKWRAMRTLGIDEAYITGPASDKEKFLKWAETVPYTLRNPLFHWTHLELKRYFGIEELLTPDTAERIYAQCNAQLQSGSLDARDLLTHMKVETVCTTDDPLDSLSHHQVHQATGQAPQLLPTFRPDKFLMIDQPDYLGRISQLSALVGKEISSFKSLVHALQERVDFFHSKGCRLSDHGLAKMYPPTASNDVLEAIFQKCLRRENLSKAEVEAFAGGLMHALGNMYAAKGWTMQLHLGPLRNNSTRMMQTLGPDTGFDSIGDLTQGEALSAFLDALDKEDQLPQTILYNLNPRDNELMATMIGNFNDGSIRGKMQWGSAWWFLDQKDGMEKQLNTLSNMGLLSCFVGMLTDSRSFLSFPRHEYFRRILCNLIGQDVHKGELPEDEKWLGKIVQDICYFNAKAYFNF